LPDILENVILGFRHRGIAAMGLLLAFSLAACHKEEQVVEGVKKKAENAEHQAQVKADEIENEREQLRQIPLPTKSLYIDVHDPAEWSNPFLSVGPDVVTLRILMPDENPSPDGQGSMLRPVAARRQELQLRVADLGEALVAIPAGAWHYGRVIAVAESPSAAPKERPKVRRNEELVMQRLYDLGVVVEEWPSR
jgi:hypothetical protein